MPISFAGKRIIVGVTGSIAAFKVAGWVSALAKDEALVDVVLTEAAARFVSELTFTSLSGRPVYTDLFAAELEGTISHIGLARSADCILVAPATAQTIARLAQGMADDLLSTTVLAANVPVIVCPAMNAHMYSHPATIHNIEKLKNYGYQVIDPDSGLMACGEEGSGRLPEWGQVADYVLRQTTPHDLAGRTVLVTAGPTREPCDPARFISNRSSGKMGYALARTAFIRGADVTLVSGPTSLPPPSGIDYISVSTAQEMYDAVMDNYQDKSIIVKAAAVSDFSCSEQSDEKIKKDRSTTVIKLKPNPDILKKLGAVRDPERQLLIGFAAESSDIEEEGRKKFISKKLDLIVVNDITAEHAGFEVDTNQVTLIDSSRTIKLLHTSKLKTADLIWDHVVDNDMLRPLS
jgi:phosphopantothenoylcysteine decarboxylase/phosphopantothenate--cysteine ligase